MAAPASTEKLTIAIGDYEACAALRDGRVAIPGVELQQVSVTPISNAILRMCRGLEFDVCEMSLVTFFAARRYGIPITGIPVFPLHGFEHGYILYNEDVVRTPKDLEGKKVGGRAYTQTPGVWMRGILQDEHGVDLSKITWVMSGEEHVEQFHKDAPPNVQYQMGADLPAMLASGELAAGLRVRSDGAPNVKPLCPDAEQAALAAFERTGVYPIGHCVCIRDDVLAQRPELAQQLLDAFKQSKEAFLKQSNTAPSRLYEDPMPIGLPATRRTLEALMDKTVAQGILEQPLSIDELFPGNLQ